MRLVGNYGRIHGPRQPSCLSVWPKEQSLATSGVSRHLARLPAVSGDSFTTAVDVIERFPGAGASA